MFSFGWLRRMLLAVFFVGAFCTQGMAQRRYDVGESSKIFADIFDNCYVVTGDRVAKLDSTLALVYRYRSNYGEIESVDASDPFKLLVFQKDFFRITFLDNAFAPLGESVFLPDAGSSLSALACNTNDGGYWVFDGLQDKLLFFRNGHEPAFSSGDLSALLGEEKPTRLQCSSGLVFLGVSNRGVAVFDKFWGYKCLVPIPEAAAGFASHFGKIFFADTMGDICSVTATGLGDKRVVLKKRFEYQGFAVGKNYLFFVNGNSVFSVPYSED